MPIDNNYNRLIAKQVDEINQRYIETFGNDATVASRITADANKEGGNRMKGGTILGNDHYAFTTPQSKSDWSSLYANAIHNPLLASNAGLVWNSGKYQPYHDTGEIGEKVEHILVGGYSIRADEDDLKEGEEIISDEGKAYRKSGGFFWFIAIAIALAKKAAAKAAAIALKKAIAAAKAAVKAAVKKKVKGQVKAQVKKKVQDKIKEQIKNQAKNRIKEELKGEVKETVKETARERLARLQSGNVPAADSKGFDKIVARSMELEELKKDPVANATKIKQKQAAIQRSEAVAQKKGLKTYLQQNRVGKDENFSQADVDKLRGEIEQKVRAEKAYDLKRANEEVERINKELRDNKANAQKAYDEASKAKHSTQEAITQKDRDIKDLKIQFERTLARKKAERDAKEDKLIQKKRDYEEAQKVKEIKRRNYIKELGSPEERKKLEETLKKEEEARKEAERKAKEAEEARIAAEKQAELEEKQRVEDERVKKEEEAISYKMAKKEEAHRVGNLNDLAPVPERAPPVTRGSYFGGNKKNKRAEVVRNIMKEKGLSMIEASKYVKQHNLY